MQSENYEKHTRLSYKEICKLLTGDKESLKLLFQIYDCYINTLCFSVSSCEVDFDEKQELLLSLYLALKKFKIK